MLYLEFTRLLPAELDDEGLLSGTAIFLSTWRRNMRYTGLRRLVSSKNPPVSDNTPSAMAMIV